MPMAITPFTKRKLVAHVVKISVAKLAVFSQFSTFLKMVTYFQTQIFHKT
jgi:hypothetical protein